MDVSKHYRHPKLSPVRAAVRASRRRPSAGLSLLVGTLALFLVPFLVLLASVSAPALLVALLGAWAVRRSRTRLVFLSFLLVIGRSAVAPLLGRRGRRRRGGRLSQIELRQRRHELLVALLFGAGATDVEYDVFVWVHFEKVAALVREVARVTAFFAGRTDSVGGLVDEPSHHFSQVVFHDVLTKD